MKSFLLSEIEAVIVGSPQVHDKAHMVVDHLHSRPRVCRIPLHGLSREVCVQDGYPMHARVFKEKTLETVEAVRPVSAAGGHWRIRFGELKIASI